MRTDYTRCTVLDRLGCSPFETKSVFIKRDLLPHKRFVFDLEKAPKKHCNGSREVRDGEFRTLNNTEAMTQRNPLRTIQRSFRAGRLSICDHMRISECFEREIRMIVW